LAWSRSEVIRASIFKFLDEHASLLELVKEVEKMKRVVPRAKTEYDMRTEEGRQQVRDVLEKFLDEEDEHGVR
jgi:Arc/MetJ-type ribon-helix-helix transcriptional regulator